MKTKKGVILAGLHPVMRPVLVAAESTWRLLGRPEGATITSGLDGVHSAGSLHPYGMALDFRTRYFSPDETASAAMRLRDKLGIDYQVVVEKDHIHVEPADHVVSKIFALVGAKWD